ncbi:MAG: ribokinase [Alphaproteobacteria bacterium]|jgi:ribokinase|nr:ribokinase [Alphaproteobacteria bacterium]MBP9868179.1 ribokinase [Alphaproteobacteria bacterium]
MTLMIIVFGSINMDMSVRLEKLPVAGETVLSTDYDLYPGGKGANQALAAARAGARVALVGKSGNDDYGRKITESLKSNGVMTSGVARSEDHPTGCAVVARDAAGAKQAIVMCGANMEASNEQVPDEILIKQNLLLMQMELPVAETVTLLERAKAHGVTTILNLAPAITIPRKALGVIDYLIVNSIEARQIAEKLHMGVQHNALKMAQALAIEGHMNVIVTLGRQGSIAVTKDQKAWGVGILEVDQSEIVDNTGAGDAFCGTFAASIHAGYDLPEALRRASVAGTLACLKEGAQSALPYLDDIEARLPELPPAISVAF